MSPAQHWNAHIGQLCHPLPSFRPPHAAQYTSFRAVMLYGKTVEVFYENVGERHAALWLGLLALLAELYIASTRVVTACLSHACCLLTLH
ncbi:uncharacterized [Tachysurus ichikawai]